MKGKTLRGCWSAVIAPGASGAALASLLFANTMLGESAKAPAGEPLTIAEGQWTWASGSDRVADWESYGIYGTQGQAAPANVPGARSASVSWTDASGNFWLFGGDGYGATMSVMGYLNDLWKWDGTSWTWVSGSNEPCQYGTYGTKGVAAPGNVPGAREGAVSWKDAAGNFWLFGGFGSGAREVGYLNDLWKWDGSTWTWVSGSPGTNQAGAYGTKGTAAAANLPGGRWDSVSWSDASGTLWLFGGYGEAESGTGYLNDLWKWDGTSWTWVSGSKVANEAGSYGTRGTAAPGNVPGARGRSVSWADSAGNLWLFGGDVVDATIGVTSYLNDLWKWDGTNWTWVAGSNGVSQFGTYGTKGEAAAGNVPGGRFGSVSWTDARGNVWLFGGYGLGLASWGLLNDLWKWDGTSWTWVGGTDGANDVGTYGAKGVADPGNLPWSRHGSVGWRDAVGNLWLFGGHGEVGSARAKLHDLWKWDGTAWTWVSGPNPAGKYGSYGTKGAASAENVPGGRANSASWTDTAGNLWLFGGEGLAASSEGWMNDLWKWDGTNWTWVSGSNNANRYGVYGAKGVPASGNFPGPRSRLRAWTNAQGDLWIFGGLGYGATRLGILNDLWKRDGAAWTWLSGGAGVEQPGDYGTKGVAAATNVPGGRSDSASWTDAGGNLWLFGGSGLGATSEGSLNDLWKWDGTSWTWMSGSNAPNQHGTYGARGVTAPENVPGARDYSVSWTDASGSFWLFGGYGEAAGSTGYLNDLWQWNGTSWTWVGGSNEANGSPTYGAKGVPSSANVPGARAGSVAWTDSCGIAWLFGGTGYGTSGLGILNDLWRWDGATWTWVSGSNEPHRYGAYGTKGVAAAENVPGPRSGFASWRDTSGNLWLLGGFGQDARSFLGKLNDLWVFGMPSSVPSAPTAWNDGPTHEGGTISLTASTVLGATYSWTGPNGFTSALQNPTIPNATVAMSGTYSVTATVGSCTSPAGTTTVAVYPPWPLTVAKSGSGLGTVSSSPAGISCGTACTASFAHGDIVVLTAVADPGSRFAGWSGASCAGTGACTLTMDAAKTVAAVFLSETPSRFYTVAPCRAVDTRNATGALGGPALSAGATRAFQLGGACGVPADATAVSLNVTVADATAPGTLTMYPGTGPAPVMDTVDFVLGKNRANNVTMGLLAGTLSVVDRQATGNVNLTIDVYGYYR